MVPDRSLSSFEGLQSSEKQSGDEPGLRESRFDVAALIRPQLDALIAGQEQALSAEYYFLAGEHECVAALFKGRQLKKLTEREQPPWRPCLYRTGHCRVCSRSAGR
jgi:hypothetical protein